MHYQLHVQLFLATIVLSRETIEAVLYNVARRPVTYTSVVSVSTLGVDDVFHC